MWPRSLVQRCAPKHRGPLRRAPKWRGGGGASWFCTSVASEASRSSEGTRPAVELHGGPAQGTAMGGRPVVRLKSPVHRQLHFDLGHPWIYDNEVENISELGVHAAGTIVDIVESAGTPLGVGVLNRQASIVVRRLDGLQTGAEVTPELLRRRLRAAFAARVKRGSGEFCRAVHGEQDGLPGLFVDRFGTAAVAIFESLGSAKLEFLLQEELLYWMGQLKQFVTHRMNAKKEKWAQDGSEFTTNIVRGESSRIAVVEPLGTFEFECHHGVAGHWNYTLEVLRREAAQLVAPSGGTILDAWSHLGQWGIRCAQLGAAEVVLLEDSLGFAQVCRDNIQKNGVDTQCTVLHRGDVLDELRSMASSGICFSCVALNVRVRFERYVKHRRGQFGRWYKPSLKGYETAVYLGALVTGRGGYLVISFLLPLVSEHWAWSLVQDGLARASRVGSLVYHVSGVDDQSALASSAMDDSWIPVVMCVRLS